MSLQSQISVGLYPTDPNDVSHQYIYSKAMRTIDAASQAKDMIGRIQKNDAFVSMEKKEGLIFIRSSDIKTILVKETDANYTA